MSQHGLPEHKSAWVNSSIRPEKVVERPYLSKFRYPPSPQGPRAPRLLPKRLPRHPLRPRHLLRPRLRLRPPPRRPLLRRRLLALSPASPPGPLEPSRAYNPASLCAEVFPLQRHSVGFGNSVADLTISLIQTPGPSASKCCSVGIVIVLRHLGMLMAVANLH